MSDTSIQWTNKVWNPVRGCSRVSEGCRNCYAERVAARFSDANQPFHLFADRHKSGSKWTGKVELIENMLNLPLKWRKPQKVFVNSMSDLFHEALSDEAIDRVFAVMALCPQHTFQVLTKRPERMLRWFEGSHERRRDAVADQAQAIRADWCFPVWPLPNVWIGVSVENQATADARIPLLHKTPAAVRFVSYEPALDAVRFDRIEYNPGGSGGTVFIDAIKGQYVSFGSNGPIPYVGLDWIIIGGESGPGARPFDITWARSAIEQCKAAGVAAFVKQFGAKPFDGESLHKQIHDRTCDGKLYLKLKDRKGGDMSEWPADLRVREFPKVQP